jgi:hypothetical protein
MKRIAATLLTTLATGCGGMAVDELPDGGVDGTHSAYADDEPLEVTDKWCIGCLAGVSKPRNIEVGYGLRPINETIAGRSYQFPACQGTETSMPHACRFPTGNKVFFGAPPSSWSSGTKSRYWDAVARIGAELNAAGWSWNWGKNGNPDPWDGVDSQGVDQRYRHTEVLVKNNITNSPHPMFKLTLQGTQNTPSANYKTYLACEIEFDYGPLGITNNGGHCTGGCTEGWSPEMYDTLRDNVFTRALSRCIGLGGNQLPIYEWDVGEGQWANCWAQDGFSCMFGGGDGMLRKEWFPDGWWSQTYWKSCLGSTQASCVGAFPSGGPQFLSGLGLLSEYLH